ncbi:MAG: polyprenyl synthetase family protein [Kofleriaceae bacterium]|nr:polyprenyl synthetase family protein [Kofleriaceae bacterium]MBP9172096.1 polyprenyl synthetase family protein [Kofleriaceae bacterium]MBP9859586.1 polyprenyl synthetase family protein [Kofleriaceae bacterium]
MRLEQRLAVGQDVGVQRLGLRIVDRVGGAQPGGRRDPGDLQLGHPDPAGAVDRREEEARYSLVVIDGGAHKRGLASAQPHDLTSVERAFYERGKRVRPIMLLLSARLHAGAARLPEKAIMAAVSLEMLHVATLIHDDVIDDAPLRRGLPSIHAARGPAAAIVLGDMQFVQAIRTFVDAIDTESEMGLVKLVLDTAFRICAGELEELETDPAAPPAVLRSRASPTTVRSRAARCAGPADLHVRVPRGPERVSARRVADDVHHPGSRSGQAELPGAGRLRQRLPDRHAVRPGRRRRRLHLRPGRHAQDHDPGQPGRLRRAHRGRDQRHLRVGHDEQPAAAGVRAPPARRRRGRAGHLLRGCPVVRLRRGARRGGRLRQLDRGPGRHLEPGQEHDRGRAQRPHAAPGRRRPGRRLGPAAGAPRGRARPDRHLGHRRRCLHDPGDWRGGGGGRARRLRRGDGVVRVRDLRPGRRPAGVEHRPHGLRRYPRRALVPDRQDRGRRQLGHHTLRGEPGRRRQPDGGQGGAVLLRARSGRLADRDVLLPGRDDGRGAAALPVHRSRRRRRDRGHPRRQGRGLPGADPARVAELLQHHRGVGVERRPGVDLHLRAAGGARGCGRPRLRQRHRGRGGVHLRLRARRPHLRPRHAVPRRLDRGPRRPGRQAPARGRGRAAQGLHRRAQAVRRPGAHAPQLGGQRDLGGAHRGAGRAGRRRGGDPGGAARGVLGHHRRQPAVTARRRRGPAIRGSGSKTEGRGRHRR